MSDDERAQDEERHRLAALRPAPELAYRQRGRCLVKAHCDSCGAVVGALYETPFGDVWMRTVRFGRSGSVRTVAACRYQDMLHLYELQVFCRREGINSRGRYELEALKQDADKARASGKTVKRGINLRGTAQL